MPGLDRPCVLVPAYNEAATIERNLRLLTAGLERDEVDVLVVCNGCRDDTAARARAFAPLVRVLELEQASKVAALNAGEREGVGYPRVFLDADVGLDSASLRRLIEHARRSGALAAEPRPHFVTDRSSFWVRAYYAVWRDLHGREPGRIGSGVLVLSQAARERFGSFPELIADDAFVRRHFGPGELVYVEEATSIVQAPRGLSDLLKIKTRSRLGSRQLAAFASQANFAPRAPGPSFARRLARLRWRVWPLVPVYLGITLWLAWRVRELVRAGVDVSWARDESSRQG